MSCRKISKGKEETTIGTEKRQKSKELLPIRDLYGFLARLLFSTFVTGVVLLTIANLIIR